ncbi:conserved hypothetical protein [Ixodes scapularis]|uniref:Uncharacterized protein n=1 Tax=Ixodes scapularis TaxID=6945 RepID=B7PLU5_IXOSC|nr:conserved hypothetical protein [Ixodes scapularis]|eukprot:XP_002434743.1 conserved hypothetical protein [Ixodes scapularis]
MQQRSPFREVHGKMSRRQLCLECMRTVDLCVGAPVAPCTASWGQMNSFSRKVFGEPLWEKCQRERYTNPGDGARSRLQVQLLRSEGIFGRTGGASASCRLWVEDGGLKAAPPVVRKWRANSSIVFLVELDDPSSSSLVLELWAGNPADVRNTPKTLHRSFGLFVLSLGHSVIGYFKPARKELLGRIEKRLQDLSLSGSEEWHLLRDSVGAVLANRVQLSVKVRVGVAANFSVLHSIRNHYALSYAFLEYRVEHSAESDVSEWTSWLHCVGREAFSLLRHHATQNNIEDTEANYCHLLALTEHRIRVNTQISFAVMLPLLKELQLQLVGKKRAFVADALELLLRGLSDHINVQLANLHDQFYLQYERHVMDLSAALSICGLIQLTGHVRAVDSARDALRKNEDRWYASLSEDWDENTDLVNLASTLTKIRDHQTKANEIFLRVWNETYTNIVINQLDDFFVENIRPRVERLVADVKTAHGKNEDQVVATSKDTFTVVSNFLRQIIPLAKNNEDVEMNKYREWFGVEVVERWFCLASRANHSVLGFVAEDDLLPMNVNVKYSSSFARTVDAINENVVSLWLQLDWPVQECASFFIESVHKCTWLYAIAIQEKVRMEPVHEMGSLPARLCVAINDLTATVTYINGIRSNIVETFAASSQTLDAFHKVDAKLERAIQQVNVSKNHVQDVAVLGVLPHIEQRLESILYASSTVAQEKGMELMLKQVTACLTMLRGNLETDAFDAILQSFWDKLTALLVRLINRLKTWTQLDPRARSRPYLGMSLAIQQLASSFAIHGCGLPLRDIAADVAEHQRDLRQAFQVPGDAGDA